MQSNTKGYAFAGLTALLWASTAGVTKLLLETLNNVQILLFTSLFATISLLLVCLWQKKLTTIKSYGSRDYRRFALMGLIGAFAYRYLWQAALQVMPAQEAFIINYTWPIMVVICAVLILKEKMTTRKFVAIGLSFIGVVIVATGGDFSSFKLNMGGVLFALAGAVAYGLFSVLAKKYNDERFTSTMLYHAFAFLYSLVAVLIFSKVPLPPLRQLGGLAWLGVFGNGLGFVFWALALKHGDTAKMSNLILATPFLSLVYIHFLVGETILISSLIGLCVIVAGIVIQSTSRTNVAPA